MRSENWSDRPDYNQILQDRQYLIRFLETALKHTCSHKIRSCSTHPRWSQEFYFSRQGLAWMPTRKLHESLDSG